MQRILLLLALGVGAAGCASVTPPDGGQQDKQAPRLLTTLPANRSVGYGDRTITLVFSEPVTLNQLGTELHVTPQTATENLKVAEKDNILTLTFEKDFAPNTTYSVALGKAVVDITERNVADSVTVLFSTGTYLDSGAVRGSVRNLLTRGTSKDVLVGLYAVPHPDSARTATPGRKLADYSTAVAADGSFHLNNIKAGVYRLFAFADANKSRRYEEPELVGYLPKPLVVGGGDTVREVRISRLDTRPPLLSTRKEADGSIRLKYSEGLQSVRLVTGSASEAKALSYRREEALASEVIVFGTPTDQNQRFVLFAQDSAGNQHVDSVTTRFRELSQRAGTRLAEPPKVVAEQEIEGQYTLIFPYRIQFSKPTIGNVEVRSAVQPVASQATPDTAKPADKVVASESLQSGRNARLDSSRTVLHLTLPAKKAASGVVSYAIRLDSTAITLPDLPTRAISGRPLVVSSAGAEAASTGAVILKLNTSAPSFAVELLRADNTLVKRYTHWSRAGARAEAIDPLLAWDGLPAGTYWVRVLIDKNRNGKWDGAEPGFAVAPEPVVFGPAELAVRANWEQEMVLTF